MDDTHALPRPATMAGAPRVVDALVDLFRQLGVRRAFGVSGGAIAAFWAAVTSGGLQVVHFRHESGAAFAATEASLATGEPVVVFVTTGPGLTNALTGMLAARGEGARVILVSAFSSPEKQGRFAIQETGPATVPDAFYRPGPLFHAAWTLESGADLDGVAAALAEGLSGPLGFTAHIALPTGLQGDACELRVAPHPRPPHTAPDLAEVARRLREGSFAVWLGHGARHAAAAIRALAEQTGAGVFCSPRAKGIFPEDHPQFVGVTGMGGHDTPRRFLRAMRPRHVLVLGTRLGEATSFWDPSLVPDGGFVHVDLDPTVHAAAYPEAPTLAVTADIGTFVTALLPHLPASDRPLAWNERAHPAPAASYSPGPVRPEALMRALQHVVIDGSDATVLAESGNSFAWTTHHLRIKAPLRYRVSTFTGAMGHAAAGVIGTALATGRPALAVVGDGAMLMTNEISTAVQHAAPCIWVVLNDARYNMCAQGMATLGLRADASIPPTNFAALATALGATGMRVTEEAGLEPALREALAASCPVVVDVVIDPDRLAPAMARNRGLRAEGIGAPPADLVFPRPAPSA